MNANQENKVSRNYKIRTFFTNHLATLSVAAPILSTRVLSFNTDLDKIQLYDIQATENITGAFIQKNLLRTIMADKAVSISGALVSQALSVNDNLKAKRVKLVKTDVMACRDTEALYQCNRVLEFAQASTALLIPYGVTAIKITELAAAVTNYKNYIQIPKEEKAESVANGEFVDKAISDCDNHLLIIDGVMAAISENFPLLYLQYTLDRAIDDETGGSESTPPDFTIVLLPGAITLITSLPYQAARQFKAKNTGTADLNWALSTNNANFTSPNSVLTAGSTSIKLSSTLAPVGDFLLVENPSPTPITVEVTIIEI